MPNCPCVPHLLPHQQKKEGQETDVMWGSSELSAVHKATISKCFCRLEMKRRSSDLPHCGCCTYIILLFSLQQQHPSKCFKSFVCHRDRVLCMQPKNSGLLGAKKKTSDERVMTLVSSFFLLKKKCSGLLFLFLQFGTKFRRPHQHHHHPFTTTVSRKVKEREYPREFSCFACGTYKFSP